MTGETAPPIPEDLDALAVPLDEMSAYPRNPRRRAGSVIRESLLAHGQYRPIVVNRGTRTGRPNEILAGNGTYAEAQEMWAEDEGLLHENIPYRGAKPGDSARAFVALTNTIATPAYAPGWVWAFGMHFHAGGRRVTTTSTGSKVQPATKNGSRVAGNEPRLPSHSTPTERGGPDDGA